MLEVLEAFLTLFQQPASSQKIDLLEKTNCAKRLAALPSPFKISLPG